MKKAFKYPGIYIGAAIVFPFAVVLNGLFTACVVAVIGAVVSYFILEAMSRD